MKNNLLFVLFLFILSIQLGAQNPMWNTTLINAEKGLPHEWVHIVFKDRWGYNWFGTENGLCRFDGKRFKIFQHEQGNEQSISFNLISDIADAADGKMWLAINGGGLSLFNPHSGQTTNLSMPIHSITHTTSSAGKTVCLDKQGKIWYGCYNNGLYSFDSQTNVFNQLNIATDEQVKTNSFEKNSINDLVLDKNDPHKIWIASNDHLDGLLSINTITGQIKHYGVLGSVMAMLQDREGELWLGTWGGGLVRYDIKTQEHTAYYLEPQAFKAQNWNANVVRGMSRKSNTELWVACYDKGLWIFDTVKKTFSKPDFLPQSLPPIFQMSTTEKGDFWLLGQQGALGVQEKKVLPLRKGFIPKSPCTDFRMSEISDLVFDPLSKKTFITYGECDGVFAFDENLKPISNAATHLDSIRNMKALLLDTNGTLWVGGNANPNLPFSLYQLNKETLQWSPVKIAALDRLDIHNTNIKDLIQARNGDIWIANNVYGLIRFSPQSGYAETPLYDINKDKKLIIQSLKESSTGDIWAISESHGVIQYSPMTKEIKVYQHDFQRLNSFFEKGGNTIEEAADGTIWVGMRQNGIQIIDPKKTIDQPLNAIGLADGLPNLTIIKILRDKQDNMWISTQNGMCAYIWTSKQIRRLGFGEHLADFSNQNKGFYRNTEGAFFLGGVKDFTVFNPETILSISHLSLNIRITDIKVLGNSVRIDQPIESIQRFEIEPSENYLTINFAAVESFNPSLINYRYRLNTTNEWINSGNQSELTFANLPDGDLDFEVQSTNEEGIWQNESALVRLYIRPYWYSSGWFRLLLITSVLTVGYSVYKNRIQTLQKKHDIALQINDLERTALAAQMNPHFIFNCLNSIQLLIQEGDKDNAMQYLGNFASLVRSTLESTRRGKISVLEEAQTLEHYLTLEKLRFKEGLKYSISIDTNIDTFDTELPAMLIQPFVENALKHGLSTEQSAQINIQFRKLNTYFLVIEITDNGKGFDTNCSKSDNTEGGKSRVGIALSRQRLALLNGREDKNDLKIVPLFDKTGEIKGTQVKMTVKVSQI